jgi:hypothetical protein
VVLMLRRGNEKEKLVIDARLRMSRGPPIHVGTSRDEVGGWHAHGSRSPGTNAKQATATAAALM